jgi:enterochelin esterase family protein
MNGIWKVCFLLVASSARLQGAVVPPAEQGNVEYHVYQTQIGKNLPGGREGVYVYTPPGYDPRSSETYPVLYLLHGFDQNALSWQTQGDAQHIIDELISQGKARPMIVVMPFSYGDYEFFRSGEAVWLLPRRINENVDLFSQMLLSEIIPRVERSYRVSRRREDRAIAGLSMGGREAISIGLENPSKFAWIGGFSAAFPDYERDPFAHMMTKPEKLRLVWIACGTEDQYFLFKQNMRLIADLTQEGLPVTPVVTHGIHGWPVWQRDLAQFVPLLFQSN